MESLYLLIPIALLFAVVVIWLLIWAVNNGQYDDLEKDGWRSLNDEMKPSDTQRNDDKSD
ncbi:cytochrome oxidase maturation protein, cbb3-type [Luminiphilus syltensis NOR5-1B]|uniref:Cytochrome oxidase maturation protein, cbb3-type n=1 Tax=Luminiphilus syltensis NOR5-1B TaxID=565045 RepID=B8KR13_9GAMM|nr:cbb3-type cytochrome oxidase assembly protein CcoS [Luminiphilus syltensis]EED34544.1 cytochrome oxidase maturation protein, cbb3-type [Luminiphilus syltensis NOR5-1B]